MTMYQPGIPTGSVPLNVDYQNIQDNFQQLDTTFGGDHIAYSIAEFNGYHTVIHDVPFSTTTSNPPNNQPIVAPTAIAGIGQIFTAQINDGYNTDEALYYLTGGNRLMQLTRNFVPNPAVNGYTFLPGGLIIVWGFTTGIPSPGTLDVDFPLEFTTCYNVSVTGVRSNTGGDGIFVLDGSVDGTGFTLRNNSSSLTKAFWTAIGI